MAKPDIVLCTPVRTPIGTYGGALKDIPASDLGAAVIRETLRRSGAQAIATAALEVAAGYAEVAMYSDPDHWLNTLKDQVDVPLK